MLQPVRIGLMPGVRLTALQTRAYKRSVWSLCLHTQLRRETAAVTALLPSVLLGGSARLPDRRLLRGALDALYGASVSPVVALEGERQIAGFEAVFLDDALVPDRTPLCREAAGLLGSLLVRPATRNGRLRGDHLEAARQRLLTSLAQEEGDPVQAVFSRLVEKMCPGEPVTVGRMGSARNLEAVRIGRLNNRYHAWLRESPVEVGYCGSLSPDLAAQAWTEALMGLPRAETIAEPEPPGGKPPRRTVRQVQAPLPGAQDRLALGFRIAADPARPEDPALDLLAALLGAGAERRLDREKGLLLLQFALNAEEMDARQEALLSHLEALRAGSCPAAALESAQRRVLGQLTRIHDSPTALLRYCTSRAGALSLEERAALVQDAGGEDLARAAERLRLDTVCRFAASGGGEV